MPDASHDSDTPASSRAVRRFGRLQLLQLLGKSERTMAWRVAEPRRGQEWMLVLPRQPPNDAEALEHWQQATRRAARLNHPQLATMVETGVQDGWPFVAYDLHDSATLVERLTLQGLPGADAATLAVQLLLGLAYAHEAGMAHHDPQPYLVLVSDGGQVRLAGLEVAAATSTPGWSGPRPAAQSPAALRLHRAAAERDVLATGVLLHGMLTGASALAEPDTGRVIARLPPLGREIVRLPWTTAHAIAEPLRAIANRATDRQPRQRYRSARTLLRALEGWLQTEAEAGGGPLALLSDRLRTAGVLPSSPGAAARAARLALMERERTNELAEVVLQDLALSFEMLRLVNSAQVRGAQIAGSGPVLTVRRAIAMLGLEGVRRSALALRAWPGPLEAEAAAELQRLVDRCKHAGRAALALRPAGYDGEVVYLVTQLQSLGRLVVHYHFAEEAQQIRRLMQPAPPLNAGEREQPGMTEEAASFAVIGVDVEAIGAAVARWWGLDEGVLAMIRRLPLATPVRAVENDDEMLRAVASCANEAVDALDLPGPRQAAALQRVVQRYGRLLAIGLPELRAALQGPGERPPPLAETEHAPQQAAARPDTLRTGALDGVSP
jgi:non-specific serine/threonine protein kinase